MQTQGSTIATGCTPPIGLWIGKIIVVDVEFDPREFERGSEINVLNFGVSFSTENHSTVEFIMIKRQVVGVSSFASDLF